MGKFNQYFAQDTSEKMKVSNANTEPLDGKDLKIIDIIHSLEKPRYFQTIHDIENFEIFSTMGSVCIITHLHFLRIGL